MFFEIDRKQFKDEVLDVEGRVLVDVEDGNSGIKNTTINALRMVRDAEGEPMKIVRMDARLNPEILRDFNITELPTVLFFENGVLKQRHTGVSTHRVYKKKLDSIE